MVEAAQLHSADGAAPSDARPRGGEGRTQPARRGEPAGPLKVMLLTVGLTVGGTEGQILELASRLDGRRFEVLVCALKGEGPLARDLQARGVRVVTLNGRGPWDFAVLSRLVAVIRREAPDVVHSFLGTANLASRLAGYMARVPVLLASYRDREIWSSPLHEFIDRATIGRVHAATCCSDAVRQFVMARVGGPPGKFVTIHNGVDLSLFGASQTLTKADVGLREGLSVIGTVCRLVEPKKGLGVLLEALARLAGPAGSFPCQLLIVGEGPAESQLRQQATRLGLSGLVVFAGMRRDVPQLLALMDTFVMASRYEGFGIAILEAMAASRPVVASNTGGIPEIVIHGETGVLVPPDDPPALASAIGELLRRPDRAVAFGRRGQQRARTLFSIESMVKRHEELYESLLAGRR